MLHSSLYFRSCPVETCRCFRTDIKMNVDEERRLLGVKDPYPNTVGGSDSGSVCNNFPDFLSIMQKVCFCHSNCFFCSFSLRNLATLRVHGNVMLLHHLTEIHQRRNSLRNGVRQTALMLSHMRGMMFFGITISAC